MSYTRHLQTYKENQIQTADPGTVLLMLYDGAIDFVKRARASVAKGDAAEKGQFILKAHDIIAEFLTALDFEVGGDMARDLERLYVYMLDQLTIANLNNDPKPLDEVVSLLSTLKEGWQEAVVAGRKRSAEEGT